MKWYGPVLVKSFILVASFISITRAEVFTALVDLEPLLRTEGEIVKTLGRYLAVEEQRLENLRRLRREYERLHVAAMNDADTFLLNPVNAYLLVKRLTADWKTAGRLIDGAYSRAVFENITHQDFIFPDDEDLSGAAAALLRLQDTYLLDTSKLARGEIEGTATTSQLSAADCFELGYQAYKVQDYYHTVLWLQEALNRFQADELETVHKHSILEHLAFGTFNLGNVEHAVKISEDLLEIAPFHPRGHENLAYFQMHLKNIERQKRGETGSEETETEPLITQPVQRNRVKSCYENLCRGERVKSHLEESLLHCRYTSSGSSYLLLQPVKEEVLNIDPRIVIYHDVISDKDAEIIKHLSQPKLARATVQNPTSGDLEFAHYRVSKSAWLFDKEHPTIARSSRMIGEITNLEIATAEQLQVVNYGIGGHYEPHFDFRQEEDVDDFAFFGTGNRIATWIYYLSDVDAGGATAFTDIGVNVKPRKGSAGFWYNLYRSGRGDQRTKHGGCPVLVGTKWVANKWLHEKGQELRRSCSLNPFE